MPNSKHLRRPKAVKLAGILIVPTTAPEDVFSYTQRAAGTYKLGRKGVGDGVLIVIAKNDRKVHVYVMRALEGAIPDAYAKRIINEQMQPAFRQNQFAAGLDAATTQIEKLINGEQLPDCGMASTAKRTKQWRRPDIPAHPHPRSQLHWFRHRQINQPLVGCPIGRRRRRFVATGHELIACSCGRCCADCRFGRYDFW